MRVLGERIKRLGALAGVLALLAGCASSTVPRLARPAPELLPFDSPLRVPSLPEPDAWLRHHLMFGQRDSARALLDEEAGPPVVSDALLRSLQHALVLRADGDYEGSNDLLEWADQEAERRYARNVSRTIGSYVLSERVRTYTPTAGEMAMIPYYRLMNHLALEDVDAAAVEARRIGAVLSLAGEAGSRRCGEDAMLQYVAGLVFESAGEQNDALVSLRRAQEGFDTCNPGSGVKPPAGFGSDLYRVATRLGVEEVADSARARHALDVDGVPAAGTGEVLVLLERGFVSHRTEQAIHIPIFEHDIEDLESGDVEGIARASASILARLMNNMLERGYWGSAWDDHPGVQVAHALGGAYILRLAWAGTGRPERAADTMALLVDEDAIDLFRAGDLSTIAAEEMDGARASALGRMIARGLAKYLLAREMERGAERRGGELAGFLTGRLANLAANGLERADTRSWTLLPDEISAARLALPAGTHELRVARRSPTGEIVEEIDLGTVEVRPGELVVVNRRMWGGVNR